MVFVKNIESLNRSLIENDFENICEHLIRIGTTAYDGEGFIFWEKND